MEVTSLHGFERGKAKNEREPRPGIYFDWDANRRAYLDRIKWEIEQGLSPEEAYLVDEEIEKPKKKRVTNPRGNPNLPVGKPSYDHDEILRLYHDEGISGIQIARKLGANPSTIYLVIKNKSTGARDYNGGHNGSTHGDSEVATQD